MKKKGFTLIELIVVIAIIGVLAAILVPAMLGYVKKSKITTANTTAKSVYNAFNSSLTDMDSEDLPIKYLGSTANSASFLNQEGKSWYLTSHNANKESAKKGSLSDLMSILKGKITTYFSDIEKVSIFSVELSKGGACTACGVMNGAYPGAYPKAVTVDEYNASADTKTIDVSNALNYAKTGSFI